MKIGVSSYSFWKYKEKTGASYEDISTLAKDMGYDGIEFLELDRMASPENINETARSIRAHCEAIGLPIIAYTVGGDLLRGDSDKAVAYLKGCVDTAEILGAPLMRHDATRGEGRTDWRAAIRQMAPLIGDVAAYAQEKGIRTCTENHGMFMQDAYRVEALMLAVDHPNYGWLVDIGNFACVDENSASSVTIAAPYAVHAHAKDFLIKDGGAENPGNGWLRSRQGRYMRGTVVGHGAIPLRTCVDILREAGYDGWLSYEFEGPEDNLYALENGLSYLRRLV